MLDPAFVWAVLGLLMIGAELFVPGLVIVFFGIGGLLTAALAVVVPGVHSSMVIQVLSWLGGTALSFVFLRRRLSRLFRGREIAHDGSAVAGKKATVTERIEPERPGRVRLEGTSWAAASHGGIYEPGETVEIVGQDGLTLYVTGSVPEEDPQGPTAPSA